MQYNKNETQQPKRKTEEMTWRRDDVERKKIGLIYQLRQKNSQWIQSSRSLNPCMQRCLLQCQREKKNKKKPQLNSKQCWWYRSLKKKKRRRKRICRFLFLFGLDWIVCWKRSLTRSLKSAIKKSFFDILRSSKVVNSNGRKQELT